MVKSTGTSQSMSPASSFSAWTAYSMRENVPSSACFEGDAHSFAKSVMAAPRLELSARIARTSETLHAHLRVTGPAALDTLLRSLPPTPEAAGVSNDFGLHLYALHSGHVARYVRSSGHLDHARTALTGMTSYFPAEFPVRPFRADFRDQTMRALTA